MWTHVRHLKRVTSSRESATNPRVVLVINNNIYIIELIFYLRIISEKFDDMGMEMSEEVDPSKC